MQELKANTAVDVTVGPFVDVTDGFTPQTDITLGADEAELLKHGSDTVVDISGATWVAVASCRGYYTLSLTASHTDTPGCLDVIVQDDSDCLPVKAQYMVLSEYEWDRKYGSEGVNSGQLSGVAWNGTLSAVADGTITFPASNNIDQESRIQVILTGGTNALGKSRYATYSGGTEVWNVDPAWNSDGETTPTGTVTAIVVPLAKYPTATVPTVSAVSLSAAAQEDVRDATGMSAANMDSQLGVLSTGVELSATAVDAVIDEVVAGSTTFRQMLRGFAAVLLGKASGLGTATAVYRDIADSMPVVTATVDVDGNRTAVTLDLDDTP